MSSNSNKRPLSILVITYEFTYDPFSGNGVLAKSLVKSLLELECNVTVWCCRPENSLHHAHLKQQEGNLEVISITVPEKLGWQRLDKQCAWQHFSWAFLDDERDEVKLLTAVSIAQVVCPIDWTGFLAWQSLACHYVSRLSPVLYLNFRVFSSGITNDDERKWYQAMEKQALDDPTTSLVVALSEKDKQSLCDIMSDSQRVPIKVLLPPLRDDVKDLALRNPEALQHYLPLEVSNALKDCNASDDRCLVTCVARLSPEKHVENFVDFIKGCRTTFESHHWIPFLAGSVADNEYASDIKQQLRQVAPNSIIMDTFLSPQALAAVFAKTILNFHPCQYDAFGMTIMEAAALGVPSIVQGNHQVGATALVGNGACIEVDFNERNCWESVSTIQKNNTTDYVLREIGQEAKKRALEWDEAAYGTQLLEYMHSIQPR